MYKGVGNSSWKSSKASTSGLQEPESIFNFKIRKIQSLTSPFISNWQNEQGAGLQ